MQSTIKYVRKIMLLGGQLFKQPMLSVCKVSKNLKFYKALLTRTSLPFASALLCIISVFQLLFITSFVSIFVACILGRTFKGGINCTA